MIRLTLLLFLTHLLVQGQENVLWKFVTKGRVYSSPLVDGEMVFTGSGDHTFYALNKTSGKKVWAFMTGGAVYPSPVVQGSLVYVGSADGNLYDQNGNSRKDFVLYGKTMEEVEQSENKLHDLGSILSKPAIDGQTIYFGSSDGYLYAVKLKN